VALAGSLKATGNEHPVVIEIGGIHIKVADGVGKDFLSYGNM
jgi:hypothetical protein